VALLFTGGHARHSELDVGAFVGSGLTVPAGPLASSSAIPSPLMKMAPAKARAKVIEGNQFMVPNLNANL
jgi:hypothetical protein